MAFKSGSTLFELQEYDNFMTFQTVLGHINVYPHLFWHFFESTIGIGSFHDSIKFLEICLAREFRFPCKGIQIPSQGK